jgi:hypothetical protein
MFRRRAARVSPEGPLVFDRKGRLVGMRTPAGTLPEDSRQARRRRSVEGLRKTHELDAQYDLRCAVSLFCADPPR